MVIGVAHRACGTRNAIPPALQILRVGHPQEGESRLTAVEFQLAALPAAAFSMVGGNLG